jgi:succinyl-CoA synthetase beta subunit
LLSVYAVDFFDDFPARLQATVFPFNPGEDSMNIHEYQAKEILRKYGVPVPDGHVAYNSNSARDWAKRLGEGPWMVKAQIHAGGRGKGGGVKLARTPDEVKKLAGR